MRETTEAKGRRYLVEARVRILQTLKGEANWLKTSPPQESWPFRFRSERRCDDAARA